MRISDWSSDVCSSDLWMIMSHEANFTASRDIETFSSNFISKERLAAMQAQAPRHLPMPLPINVDPPDHTKYRDPLQRVVSTKNINGLKASIRQPAATLIAKHKTGRTSMRERGDQNE